MSFKTSFKMLLKYVFKSLKHVKILLNPDLKVF